MPCHSATSFLQNERECLMHWEKTSRTFCREQLDQNAAPVLLKLVSRRLFCLFLKLCINAINEERSRKLVPGIIQPVSLKYAVYSLFVSGILRVSVFFMPCSAGHLCRCPIVCFQSADGSVPVQPHVPSSVDENSPRKAVAKRGSEERVSDVSSDNCR